MDASASENLESEGSSPLKKPQATNPFAITVDDMESSESVE